MGNADIRYAAAQKAAADAAFDARANADAHFAAEQTAAADAALAARTNADAHYAESTTAPPMLPWPLVQMPMLDLLLGKLLTLMLLMMLEQSMMQDLQLPMLLLVMPGTPVPTSILLTGVVPLLLTECGTERASVDNDVY